MISGTSGSAFPAWAASNARGHELQSQRVQEQVLQTKRSPNATPNFVGNDSLDWKAPPKANQGGRGRGQLETRSFCGSQACSPYYHFGDDSQT